MGILWNIENSFWNNNILLLLCYAKIGERSKKISLSGNKIKLKLKTLTKNWKIYTQSVLWVTENGKCSSHMENRKVIQNIFASFSSLFHLRWMLNVMW